MNFYKKHKRIIKKSAILILFCFILLFATNISLTQAVDTKIATEANDSRIAGFLTWVVLGIANTFGQILSEIILKLISFVFNFQEWNNPNVTKGWVIIRDLCNMFFIVILLVIAFATILRQENYSAKKLLPKLLIMAVLINFSKTICLFLIDISQVVMLTFASAFAGQPGNFVNVLGLNKLLAISQGAEFKEIPWNLFYSAVLALLVIVLVAIIMIMMIVMLMARIVMFWVLIVLSPIAFFSSVLPGGKYFSQWWGEFSKHLTTGPILAFFVWLSLMILSEGGDKNNYLGVGSGTSKEALSGMISEFAKWDNISKFVLAISLLIAALKIAQSAGVIGGNIGMNMANNLKSKGLGAMKKGAKWAGKEVGLNAAQLGLKGTSLAASGIGVGLNRMLGKTKLGEKLGAKKDMKWKDDQGNYNSLPAKFLQQWDQGIGKSRRESKVKAWKDFGKKMGMSDDTLITAGDMAGTKTGKIIGGGLNTAKGAVLGLASADISGALSHGLGADLFKGITEVMKSLPFHSLGLGEVAKGAVSVGNKLGEGGSAAVGAVFSAMSSTRKAYNEARVKEKTENDAAVDKKKDDDLKKEEENKESGRGYDEYKKYNERKIKMEEDLMNTKDDLDKGKITSKEFYVRTKSTKTDFENSAEKKAADARFDQRKKEIEDERNASLKTNATLTGFDKVVRFELDKDDKINRVVRDAADSLAKVIKDAKDRIKAITGGADVLSQFSPSTFYSASGQTDDQKAFFKQFSKDNTAIAALLGQINSKIAKGENLQKKEAENLRSLMQGVAAHKKGGGDMAQLSPLVDALNDLNKRHDQEWRGKTVGDYESQIIKK